MSFGQGGEHWRCPDCLATGGTHIPGCSFYTNKVQVLPTKKEFVRVVVKNGPFWFDMDKPDGFSMSNFMTAIRGTGCLLNDKVYVPLDEIQAVFIWSEDKPPQVNSAVVLPFTGA